MKGISPKLRRETEHRVPTITARRRQFQREYRKLYKETKRFVMATLKAAQAMKEFGASAQRIKSAQLLQRTRRKGNGLDI